MRYYSVFSPKFEITSGGVRVMYGLYGWLLAKGQVAFLNQYVPGSDHVAIYPEIYPGDNKSNATKVVRYILNKPGVVSAIDENGKATLGPTSFPEADLKYYFSKLFGEAEDEDHYLFLPILNMHEFKDYKIRRHKVAYFVGKGDNMNLHPENAIPITRDMAQDQTALAKLLNECTVVYQYDPVSAMSELARLCGCPVVLNQNWFTKKEYEGYEPGLEGIFWEPQKNYKWHPISFRMHYYGMRRRFEQKLERFIIETQK